MLTDFLTLNPPAFGLDIGASSIKFVKFKKTKRGPTLHSYAQLELPDKLIEGGEVKDENTLAENLTKLIFQIKGPKYAICSLPEEKGFLQIIQMPKMKSEELKKAVFFEAENYIPLPLEEIYLDFQEVPYLPEKSEHIDVLLVAFPKTTLDKYVVSLHKAGIQPLALELESLAVSRAVVPNEKSDTPILILDLGEKKTGLTIFSGSSVRLTASIAISGKSLSESVARELKIDQEEAEKVKIKYGISFKKHKIGQLVFEALIPALTGLAEEVKKYIDYYQTHEKHDHFKKTGQMKLILCGGGANLKGLDTFLASTLKMPTSIAYPWINILPTPIQEVPSLKYQESIKYATAIGLALRGMQSNRLL